MCFSLLFRQYSMQENMQKKLWFESHIAYKAYEKKIILKVCKIYFKFKVDFRLHPYTLTWKKELGLQNKSKQGGDNMATPTTFKRKEVKYFITYEF